MRLGAPKKKEPGQHANSPMEPAKGTIQKKDNGSHLKSIWQTDEPGRGPEVVALSFGSQL